MGEILGPAKKFSRGEEALGNSEILRDDGETRGHIWRGGENFGKTEGYSGVENTPA